MKMVFTVFNAGRKCNSGCCSGIFQCWIILNSGSFSGYLAITDGDRILCHNRDIKGENDFYFYLMNAKKIKLKRSIFGNLSVFIVFSKERKKIKLKFKTVKILVPELRQQNEKNINDLETFLKSKV